MNEHHCQPRGTHLFRLPMAMAQHAASIGWIDFDSFRFGGQQKSRTRQEIANDGLQVAARQPGMRLKRAQPGWERLRILNQRIGLRYQELPLNAKVDLTILRACY